jgi:hypothetical protein
MMWNENPLFEGKKNKKTQTKSFYPSSSSSSDSSSQDSFASSKIVPQKNPCQRDKRKINIDCQVKKQAAQDSDTECKKSSLRKEKNGDSSSEVKNEVPCLSEGHTKVPFHSEGQNKNPFHSEGQIKVPSRSEEENKDEPESSDEAFDLVRQLKERLQSMTDELEKVKVAAGKISLDIKEMDNSSNNSSNNSSYNSSSNNSKIGDINSAIVEKEPSEEYVVEEPEDDEDDIKDPPTAQHGLRITEVTSPPPPPPRQLRPHSLWGGSYVGECLDKRYLSLDHCLDECLDLFFR